jgi:mannose-6-phosphate isomerase-like protein (cupin superfamily)
MNTQQIIKELQEQYPGKNIVLDPVDNPTEIICEVSPTSEHPENSQAVVVAGRSKPHFHKVSTEVYEAVKGDLIIYKNGVKHILKEGNTITIEPNVIHYVEGNESWFITYSKPGWTLEDHILV